MDSSDGSQRNFQKDFQNKIDAPSYVARIQALSRINNILSEPYLHTKRPINAIDRKLVRGFFNRMLNEYKYLGNPEPDSDRVSPRDEFKS